MTIVTKGRFQRQVRFKRRQRPERERSSLNEPEPTEHKSAKSPSTSIVELFTGDHQEVEPEARFSRSPSSQHKFSRPTKAATMCTAATSANLIPELYTTLPPILDGISTNTSELQYGTVQECLPFLSGLQTGVTYSAYGIPHLDRARHIQFIHKSLRPLPAPFVAADASRPWMFYWALASLSMMGEDISSYRERLIATARPMQNLTGGFGGGHGQMSHLAPTYALILALAMVGGQESLDLIDRKAMWKWLSALKKGDGGFRMSLGGEEDVRGAYCAAVIITLLDLPLELASTSSARISGLNTLLDKLPEWVAKCQTYEGGISARPDAEAHGAYAFCALACLCILGSPHIIIPRYLDVPRLISWLSARQYAPEGGFSGRTNKLVDGCYSHWVGGCWPLLEACLDGPTTDLAAGSDAAFIHNLYNREGLIRYILCCCQDQGKRGGLRDKPSHTSDAYHTCYVLAGLSSAQHRWRFSIENDTARVASRLNSPYMWSSGPCDTEFAYYYEVDRVKTSHPVFVIPEGVAERTRAYFADTGKF